MIKGIKRAFLVICVLMICSVSAIATEPIIAIDDGAQPFDGDGTEKSPYRYLIDGESRAVWKHLVTLRKTGEIELYECREDNDINGDLLYSYMFIPENLKQTPDGPYYLGIRIYDEKKTEILPDNEKALYFSLATKRDFPGKVKIKLNVKDRFKNGDSLLLMYYGGYDSAVVHGGSPVIMKDEILEVGNPAIVSREVIVKDNCVSFFVRTGGNYVLTDKELNFSELCTGQTVHYDAEKLLGTVDGLFPNKHIAKAVANAIGCETGDKITQGDIDSIKTLYLSGKELADIKEISRTYFAHLENLDLSNNEITTVENLSMPSLTNLNLSSNKISSLSFIANLHNLQHLNASENNISSLPDFNAFPKLLTLDLQINNITILPNLDGTALRYLDISENPHIEIKADLEKIDVVLNNQQKSNSSNLPIVIGGLIVVIIGAFLIINLAIKNRNGDKKYEH